jgi:hypothetical protein
MQWHSRESCNDSSFTAFIVIEVSTNTDDLLGCLKVCDFGMGEAPSEVHSILTSFMTGSFVIISTITNKALSFYHVNFFELCTSLTIDIAPYGLRLAPFQSSPPT